jgi:hypothetical protein
VGKAHRATPVVRIQRQARTTPLLTQKQHERANQRKHAHTDSEAIGLEQNVVVDQHDAERGRQHDGERNQENDYLLLHGSPVERSRRQVRRDQLRLAGFEIW